MRTWLPDRENRSLRGNLLALSHGSLGRRPGSRLLCGDGRSSLLRGHLRLAELQLRIDCRRTGSAPGSPWGGSSAVAVIGEGDCCHHEQESKASELHRVTFVDRIASCVFDSFNRSNRIGRQFSHYLRFFIYRLGQQSSSKLRKMGHDPPSFICHAGFLQTTRR